MNKFDSLLGTVKEDAKKRGLFLHRYQTNIGRFSVRITYALHDSEQKPRKGADCSGYAVTLTTKEGITEKCQAFKELEKMHDHLNQLTKEFN